MERKSIKVDKKVYEQLQKLAQINNESLYSLTSRILNDYLSKDRKETEALDRFIRNLDNVISEIQYIKMNMEIIQTMLKQKPTEPQENVNSNMHTKVINAMYEMLVDLARHFLYDPVRAQALLEALKKDREKYTK